MSSFDRIALRLSHLPRAIVALRGERPREGALLLTDDDAPVDALLVRK